MRNPKMEYRLHPKTGDSISAIGIGCASIVHAGEKGGIEALSLAFEEGFNYYDLASGEPENFATYRKAFAGVRNEVMYQIHFGAEYTSGKYGWSTDVEKAKRSTDWVLRELGTDYIDYGFVHCADEAEDWRKYYRDGVYDFILSLKRQGVIRHIGMSSHTPSTVNLALDELAERAPEEQMDMLMFSINPGYDYQIGEYANGDLAERNALYRRLEEEKIGISVMKPFGGGQLLDKERSPFDRPMTRYQCMKYALDTPGVLTILPGIRDAADVRELAGYLDASAEEKDYSLLGSITPKSGPASCVYCNHCQPCPAGLNVGLINKYYDLAKIGDPLAADHYRTLEKSAADCVQCGHCTDRCPFHVEQTERMLEIAEYFG